jgi:AcrR family transcriptional regulator
LRAVDTKNRILEATAELLSRSADGEISTRAICAAAGTSAPTLYRLFGDKQGLLTAAVDFGYRKYTAGHSAVWQSADPVDDLYALWDSQIRFAQQRPQYFRLIWSAPFDPPTEAAREAHGALEHVLDRCESAEKLRTPPLPAAEMIMAANTGVGLSLALRPALFPDPSVSTRVRDAVFTAVLHELPTEIADLVQPGPQQEAIASTAAQLKRRPPAELTSTENALLLEWLGRISQ